MPDSVLDAIKEGKWDFEPKEFDDIADGLGEDEFVALRDDRNRFGPEALKKRQTFRIAHDINRFVHYVLGRKKLFRFKTAGSPRLPEDSHHLFHEFLLRGYRIRGCQNRVRL